MGKMIKLIVFVGLLLIFLKPVYADHEAGRSATINYIAKNAVNDRTDPNLAWQKKAIKIVLEKYQSPLVKEVDSFMESCIKYDLDCYLLPAIAGLESSFGQAIYPNSYNPFGWGRGLVMFSSWAEAIDTVGKGLREDYIDQGATTVEQIGAIYCEGNTWAGKVQYFIKQIQAEEEKNKLLLEKNPVSL